MVNEQADENGQADAVLAGLLREARDAVPVSAALSARVLADAQLVQAEAAIARAAAPVPARAGRFARFRMALGGWPALSGVTLAGMIGLALGFAAPDLVDTLSGGQIGILSGDLGAVPEIGQLWEVAGDV